MHAFCILAVSFLISVSVKSFHISTRIQSRINHCFAQVKCNPSEAIDSSELDSRRDFFRSIAVASSVAIGYDALTPSVVFADDVDPLTPVYFGVGCFWHIQHEFVEAERKLLNRNDDQLTSLTGYAGGRNVDKEGRVCYHNFQGIADYGKLGHGEVVGMTIPQSAIGSFAKEYFNLFAANGNRVDPLDLGPEYRSLLGLPGGSKHPSYKEVDAAAQAKGFKLLEGRGNDPDTLGKKVVWVMDSEKFPFYQAEVYHQFHNDFQSPPYGKDYNNLVKAAFLDKKVKDVGCPDRFPSV